MYQKMLAGLGEQGDLALLEDVSANIKGRSFLRVGRCLHHAGTGEYQAFQK